VMDRCCMTCDEYHHEGDYCTQDTEVEDRENNCCDIWFNKLDFAIRVKGKKNDCREDI